MLSVRHVSLYRLFETIRKNPLENTKFVAVNGNIFLPVGCSPGELGQNILVKICGNLLTVQCEFPEAGCGRCESARVRGGW
jgi:hypothetical protein